MARVQISHFCCSGPLNATMMKLMTYPEEPSIKEKTAFVLQMPDGIDPVSAWSNMRARGIKLDRYVLVHACRGGNELNR